MRAWIEFSPVPVETPLTRWVHASVDGLPWYYASTFDPPLPRRVIGRGWPVWVVAHRGRELRFASRAEIEHAIDVLGGKVLPRPSTLVPRSEGWDWGHANSHWLSRLNAAWRPWPVRQRLVAKLEKVVAEPLPAVA